jgi:Arc/MetJ family transcription regulator
MSVSMHRAACDHMGMVKVRMTLTVDEDVMQAVRRAAARTGKTDSEMVEQALRRELGLDPLTTLWARNQMSEGAAMELAVEAQHATRPARR